VRSAATAFAWEFRARHRWGFAALIAYFAVLALARTLFAIREWTITYVDEQTFAIAVAVPLATTFMYFLGVFTFGLSGDAAGRASMYPARMFTMPVTTDALVFWPMLYGSLAMAVLWILTRFFSLWPDSVPVPFVWPAILGPALLAWTQALTWMSYPFPGMRVIATVLWLSVIDAIVMIGLELRVPESAMVAVIAPQLPLAYLFARSAVAKARRGDVPDWHNVAQRLARLAGGGARRRTFASAPGALEWYEWRQHGRSLPVFVAILLPFELSMLFIFSETPPIIIEMVGCALMTPPFMAAFVAGTVRKSDSVFSLSRPVTNESIIAAKFRTAARSTFVTWGIVLLAVPAAVSLSGTAQVLRDAGHWFVAVVGTPRAVALGMLMLALLMLSTWKQLVQSLYAGLSGREWATKASVFGALALLTLVFPIAMELLHNKALIGRVWNAIPSILAVLIVAKLAAAMWIAVRLHRERLVSHRTLVAGAIAWDLTVIAIYGVLRWIVPDLIIRHYLLAFLAVLLAPLVRLSAAPIALARNRNR
jgi:hypothetical protein